MQPSGWLGLYIVGCFDRRITFYNQQARALSLVRALFELDKLSPGRSVAVVGAGAAGVTAAVAAARLGCSVTLFEKSDTILHLQATATHRFLHPHLYDWPELGAVESNAGLPLMDWQADFADKVIDQLRSEFEDEKRECKGRLNQSQALITDIHPRGGRGPFQVRWELGQQEADVVLLTIGFGTEKDEPLYWSGDNLTGPHAGGARKILVSGSGDGGLIDLARAALLSPQPPAQEFRHDQAIEWLTSDQDFQCAAYQMLLIDRNVRRQDLDGDPAFSLYQQYVSRLRVPRTLQAKLAALVRSNTGVTFNYRHPGVFSLESSLLNRLLAFLLVQGKIIDPMQGEIVKYKTVNGKQSLTVKRAGGQQYSKDFDLVVRRHGPDKNYFKDQFPFLEKARSELDGKLAGLKLTGTLGDDTIEWYRTHLR